MVRRRVCSLRRSELACRGLTLIEVVVVIAIVLLLLAVISPGVQSQRISTRQMECSGNIRQVALAVINVTSSQNGLLPPLEDRLVIEREGGAATSGAFPAGWPVQILPAVDHIALLKKIKKNAVLKSSNDDESVILGINESEKIFIRGFTCPQDTDSDRMPGGLSYVLNSGFIARELYYGDPNRQHELGFLSWNGNDITGEDEDVAVAAATGAVWRKNKAMPASLDYISTGDGTTNTLLLAENLHAGNWWDTETTRIAFGVPVATKGRRVLFGKGTFFESVERPLYTEFPGGTLADARPNDWRINRDLRATTGTRPRPSSSHANGVNVVMCDGSTRFLSEQIDPHLYLKLLTSNGRSFGEGDIKKTDLR